MPPARPTLRPLDPDDTPTLDAWLAVKDLVFTLSLPQHPARREYRRPTFARQRLTGAFDGDTLVGTYRSWDDRLTVPGGTVTTDAISSVTVLPTHRRRGLLTAMIRADLAAAVDREVPVAALIAAEATIYGRFGFGPSTETATWTLSPGAAAFSPTAEVTGTLAVVSAATLRDLAPAIFRTSRRPGALDRPGWWWDQLLGLVPNPDARPTAQHAVLYRDADGAPTGYLIYAPKESWAGRVCQTEATVRDLQGSTPAAVAALWRFLTELDLVATVRAPDRPVDEPFSWWLTDPRAAVRSDSCDFLWTRLLAPAAALSARRYESPGQVTFEVTDPFGYAAGRYSLVVDPDGTGVCEPTRREPDVTVTVTALSRVWLGGGDNLAGAATTRQVIEHRPAAVRTLARLLRSADAPWSGTWF